MPGVLPLRLHSALLHWPLYCPMQSNKRSRNSVDLQIFCVSCGQPISVHVALRHMERCFAKVGALSGGGWGKSVLTGRGFVGGSFGIWVFVIEENTTHFHGSIHLYFSSIPSISAKIGYRPPVAGVRGTLAGQRGA